MAGTFGKENRRENLYHDWRCEWFGEAIFFDNENGFAEVGQYRNGELQQQGAAVPVWFLELIGEWKKGVVT